MPTPLGSALGELVALLTARSRAARQVLPAKWAMQGSAHSFRAIRVVVELPGIPGLQERLTPHMKMKLCCLVKTFPRLLRGHNVERGLLLVRLSRFR